MNNVKGKITIPMIQSDYPLSDAQLGIYVECKTHGGTKHYTIPLLFEMNQNISVERLREALITVIDAHPMLKAVFYMDEEGNVRQERKDNREIAIQFIHTEDSEYEQVVSKLPHVLDFEHGVMYDVTIITTQTKVSLFIEFHHAIADGTSLQIFFRELSQVYLHGAAAVEKEIYTGFDAAFEDRILKKSDTYEQACAFYKKLLEDRDMDSLPLPTKLEQGLSEKKGALCVKQQFFTSDQVTKFCKEMDVSKTVVFTTAFGLTLKVFNHATEAVYSTIYHGRKNERYANSFGMFVKTLPVVISNENSLKLLLHDVKSQIEHTRKYDMVSFSELACQYGVTADVQFVYQAEMIEKVVTSLEALGARTREDILWGADTVRCPFQVFLEKNHAGEYTLKIEYQSNLYHEEFVESFARAYFRTVEQMMTVQTVDAIRLFGEQDRQKIDLVHNTTVSKLPARNMVEWFQNQVRKTPDSVCVVYEEKSYTYEEVDRITDQIASYVIREGGVKNSVVSVFIHRSEYMVLASIGVLKAGAAYQPLLEEYPEQRLMYMLNNGDCNLMIADRDLSSRVPDFKGKILYTDEIAKLNEKQPSQQNISLDDTFVILYTSGTTGKPKGVQLSHRNVMAFVKNYQEMLKLSSADRALGFACYGFDAHLLDLYPMLTCGGTVYLLSEEMRLDLYAINDYVISNAITIASMTTQVGQQFHQMTTADSLRHLVVGGEELLPTEPRQNYSLWNTYGPTECCVLITGQKIDKKYRKNPIGKPVGSSKVYITENGDYQVPFGAIGELVCSGHQVGMGYRHNEALTQMAFKENPFCQEEGYERIYRTGDLARFLPDGTIEFIGRKDKQVKIRGYRIELMEVELALRTYTSVHDATVAVFPKESGEKYIVGYVVSLEQLDTKGIKAFLKERLPYYMIPEVIMQIDSIPYNSNSKVDKRALPEPVHDTEEGETAEPVNEKQQQLYQIITGILENDAIGIHTNLFEAGLTSISAMRLLVILSRQFHVDLKMKELQANATIQELERLIEPACGEEDYKKQEDYPVLQNQQGIYIQCVSNPSAHIYQIPLAYEMPKYMDVKRLKKAVEAAIENFPYIKTRFFVNEAGNLRQQKQTNEQAVVEYKTMTDQQYEEMMKTSFISFELDGGRLYYAAIFETESKVVLLLNFHHCIADGTSVQLFVKALMDAYAGKRIEPETMTGYELALEEESMRNSVDYDTAKRYYDSLLSEVELGNNLPAVQVEEGKEEKKNSYHTTYSVPKTNQIREFCQKKQITENVLFMAAFGITLEVYQNSQDAVFTTIYHGRNDARYVNTFAMLVKTLPVYLPREESVDILLHKLQSELLSNMEHDIYSFAEISSTYGIQSNLQFVYQGEMNGSLENGCEALEGTFRKEVIGWNSDAIMDLLMQVVNRGEGTYDVDVDFKENLYPLEWIENFTASFQVAVEQLMLCDRVDDINLFSRRDETLVNQFNQTDTMDSFDTNVIALFQAQVQRTPENVCVVYKDHSYTYQEVDEISNRIAAYLIQMGCKKGSFVSVLIHRSEYMVIASLGILKAGAAYQPLLDSFPLERLQYMMKDAKVQIIIADRDLAKTIPSLEEKVQVLYTDEIEGLLKQDVLLPVITSEDAFLLLYTSGTTGIPKGVSLSHQNVLGLIYNFHNHFKPDETVHAAAYASYGFDAHTLEIYPIISSGGCVYVIPEEIRLDLLAINEFYLEHKITFGFFTTQVARQFYEFTTAPSLRYLLTGGETLIPVKPRKDIELWNIYGPTEGTVFVTDQQVDKEYRCIPVGKAVDNMKLYVVDKKLRQVPVGAIGELICAGVQIGSGYIQQPERTKEAFILNPFSKEAKYQHAYRTGDYVRFQADGTLVFVGRRDSQVKVNGFRIELQEVEAAIQAYPDIKENTVVAWNHNGKIGLVAYVVSDREVDATLLKAFIGQSKPQYMVPEIIMQIPKIPLTQNQKVDKRALPEPVPAKTKAQVAPENKKQAELLQLCQEVTGNEQLGIQSDLFENGLNSIGAMRLIVMILQKFEMALKIHDVKENPTVQLLCQRLEKRMKVEENEEREDYPLTQSQLGLFSECISHPNSTIYNIPKFLKLPITIDAVKLGEACRTVVNAHPFLKSTIIQNGEGEIRFKRNDKIRPEVLVCNEEPVREQLVKPFDITQGNLYRISIYQGGENVFLFMDFHHIICDGTSLQLLYHEIEQVYYGEELQQEGYTGFDVALEEERIRQTDAMEKANEYFDNLLAGCATDYLPRRERTGDKSGRKVQVRMADGADACLQFCQKHSLTENAFFMTAFAILIGKYNYREDVVFATIYNGRNDSRMSQTIDMLVKTLPVRVRYGKDQRITDVCRELGEQILNSMMYEAASFSQLSQEYGVNSDLIFVYQGENFQLDKFGDETVICESLPLDVAKTPISLNVAISGGKLQYVMEYRDDMYSVELIENMLDCYEQIVKNLLHKKTIKELSLLSDKAKTRLESFNQTSVEVESVTANILLERTVQAYPDKTAVMSGGVQRTYCELNDNANRIAWGLRKEGVKEGDFVAIMLPRSVAVYEAREGVLKAGAAFVFIDPEYGEDRISYILKDCHAKCLIISEELLHQKSKQLHTVRTILLEELLQGTHTDNPEPDIDPESIAYCIYTSGSTGKPKGVLITHGNLVNFVNVNEKNHAIKTIVERTNVCLAVTAFTFDPSIMEECVMLYNGKTVCIANEEEIHNPYQLAETIVTNRVNALICTPTLVANYVEINEIQQALKGVDIMKLGGECFQQPLLQKLKQINPDVIVINAYGPTETTIECTAMELELSEPITIGKPLGNVEIYMTDQYGNVLPAGVPGEMLIVGQGVGKGYIGLEKVTREKFFWLDKKPAYRSGDLAFWNLDGNIEFLGRVDRQVKLRGLRIELGEIETVLNRYPYINSCIVQIKGEKENQFLCAYYVSRKPIEQEALKSFLKRHLPEYMVPSVYVRLDSMPLTQHGKINEKSLPEPDFSVFDKNYKAPVTEMQRTLCEAFELALGVPAIGIQDDFFELGGTSLLASKVVMRCMVNKIPITYADIFKYKTVEALEESVLRKDESGLTSEAEREANIENGNKLMEEKESLPLGDLETIAESSRAITGNLCLTGATGFLGSHLLREYLEQKEGAIYCLVRSGQKEASERLRDQLAYYFGAEFWDKYQGRIQIVNGDITEADTIRNLDVYDFSTVINCAACVKHFAADDVLEKVNVEAVKSLAEFCKKTNRTLIQISTISVSGEVSGKSRKGRKYQECDFDIAQTIQNQYVKSKFEAEKIVLDAIKDGMSGKIIRVGNLMARMADGKFQVNAATNGFLRSIQGYVTLGKFPISLLNQEVEFSPIDSVAKAVLKLSDLPKNYRMFHAYNPHKVLLADVLDALKGNGSTIRCVSDEEFQKQLVRKAADEKDNAKISGLVSYLSHEDSKNLIPVETDNAYTTKALYLLGFSWPVIDKDYLKRAILVEKENRR